jgi:CBS domain-containing protein
MRPWTSTRPAVGHVIAARELPCDQSARADPAEAKLGRSRITSGSGLGKNCYNPADVGQRSNGPVPEPAGGAVMKKLREIMRPEFRFSIPPTALVSDAVRLMAAHNVGIVAVVDDSDTVIGVFSERDLLQRVVAQGRPADSTRLAEVMTTTLVTAEADEDYQSAMLKMDQANIRHLPVIEHGRLLSMLSIRDLMRVEIMAQGQELQHLHSYLYQGR